MKIKKRIIKNFFIQFLLALISTLYILIVRLTSKISIENANNVIHYWNTKQPFILAFWHNQLMMISFSWKIKKKINVLASGHSDGRFGAIVGKYFNLNNIPTSIHNNKISLRKIFKLIKTNNYIGITPDGPRGPKEKVSEGIIKIAKNTQIPIIPIGFSSSKNFSLASWDSFLITFPFSKCSFVWGEAIAIPKNMKDDELKSLQILVEKKINECVKKAKTKSK